MGASGGLPLVPTAGPGSAPAAGAQLSVPFDAHTVIPQTALIDIPLRRFIDQSLEGTAKAFTRGQLDACAARYRTAFDLDPPEDCDPSPEQLAALWHIMALGLAPYADFAVFNAYGARLNRMADIDTQVLGPGGT